MRKYYLIAELLIFKHRWQNISCFQYSVAYCSHLSRSDVMLWEPVWRYHDQWWHQLLWAVWGDLFFVDQGTKVNSQYYRGVLLHQQLLPAIRDRSGDFFTFQQDNAPADRAHEIVQLLPCETPDFTASALASQQSWPEPGRLPDVGSITTGYMALTNDQLKSRLIEE